MLCMWHPDSRPETSHRFTRRERNIWLTAVALRQRCFIYLFHLNLSCHFALLPVSSLSQQKAWFFEQIMCSNGNYALDERREEAEDSGATGITERCRGLPVLGTKSRNSLLNQPVECFNEARFSDRKDQFQATYPPRKPFSPLLSLNASTIDRLFHAIPTFGSEYGQTPISLLKTCVDTREQPLLPPP